VYPNDDIADIDMYLHVKSK